MAAAVGLLHGTVHLRSACIVDAWTMAASALPTPAAVNLDHLQSIHDVRTAFALRLPPQSVVQRSVHRAKSGGG